MKVDKVEYDLKLGKIISSTPLVLANQTLKNDTNHEQEMSFQLNEATSHTSTFEYTLGFTLTIGATFTGKFLSVSFGVYTLTFFFCSWYPCRRRGRVRCRDIHKQPVEVGRIKLVLEVLYRDLPSPCWPTGDSPCDLDGQ